MQHITHTPSEHTQTCIKQ